MLSAGPRPRCCGTRRSSRSRTGDWYLSFIFAEADTRHDVEKALTAARDRLRIVIGMTCLR